MYRLRTSAVIVHNQRILCFKAKDPFDHREFTFLPGGKIEDNESAVEAAVRETLEETGFDITIIPESCIDVDYDFYWNGETYQCTTLFYWGKLNSPFPRNRNIQDASYHQGVVWVPVEEVDQVFAYSEAILKSIKALIQANS